MIPPIGSQDVRYIDAIVTNKVGKEQENTALVILMNGRLIGKDMGIKILIRKPIEEEKEEEDKSEESSEEEPNFLELYEATQEATKEV